MVKHLESEDFNELIAKGTYLVDFYADWCGPCKMLAPVLEKVDFIDVIKVNVDEHMDLATKYGVMSIPTIIIFKDGNEVKKELGFKTLSEIKQMIEHL